MHARELAEFAVQLATEGRGIIRAANEIDQKGIEEYWVASRCRLDRWSNTLSQYSTRIQEPETADTTKLWPAIRPTLEEILVSEVLTRIWTVVVIGHDRSRGTSEFEPVARSIMTGQLEARHRTLHLMLRGQGFAVEEAVALNRLRRQCERWNDMLLSTLRDELDVTEFAFDMSRVCEVACELKGGSRYGVSQPAWKALLASLRVSFLSVAKEGAANADLNQQVASGIMSCFPAGVFDSLGIFRPSWLVRMYSVTSETQGILDDVLSNAEDLTASQTSVRLLEDRLRRI
jgi:hypothetical protein